MKTTVTYTNNDFVFKADNEKGYEITIGRSVNEDVQIYSPMQLLLSGLGGCSGYDIVHILSKQKVEIKRLVIKIEGNRVESVPSIYDVIKMNFDIEADISPKKMIRAIELTLEKYCSVAQIINKTAVLKPHVILNGVNILSN